MFGFGIILRRHPTRLALLPRLPHTSGRQWTSVILRYLSIVLVLATVCYLAATRLGVP